MKSAWFIVCSAMLAVGCNSTPSDQPKPVAENVSAKSAGTAAPAVPAAAPSAAAVAAPVAAAPSGSAKAEPSKGPPLFSGTFPESDSKPPSVKEWLTDAKLYTVKHSSSLFCETSALREWIRVSCRGKPGAPNQPIGVKVTKAPKKGQHYELTREGVASLVFQPRKGQTSEFAFEWSNWGTRTLTVSFSETSDKPEIAFDKAAPAGKAGLPRCEDVCATMPIYHNYLSDCAYPCGDGYKCEWWNSGEERTAMCVCATECSD